MAKKQKKITARKRKEALIEYVAEAEKVPKQPKGAASLRVDLAELLDTVTGRVVCDVGHYEGNKHIAHMTKAELRFILKACQSLGFKPEW